MKQIKLRKSNRYTLVRDNMIVELYSQNVPIKDIREKIGIKSFTTIYNAIKRVNKFNKAKALKE